MSSLGYVRESGIFSGPEFVAREFVADGTGTADGTIMRTDHQRKVPEVIGKYNLYNNVH